MAPTTCLSQPPHPSPYNVLKLRGVDCPSCSPPHCSRSRTADLAGDDFPTSDLQAQVDPSGLSPRSTAQRGLLPLHDNRGAPFPPQGSSAHCKKPPNPHSLFFCLIVPLFYVPSKTLAPIRNPHSGKGPVCRGTIGLGDLPCVCLHGSPSPVHTQSISCINGVSPALGPQADRLCKQPEVLEGTCVSFLLRHLLASSLVAPLSPIHGGLQAHACSPATPLVTRTEYPTALPPLPGPISVNGFTLYPARPPALGVPLGS